MSHQTVLTNDWYSVLDGANILGVALNLPGQPSSALDSHSFSMTPIDAAKSFLIPFKGREHRFLYRSTGNYIIVNLIDENSEGSAHPDRQVVVYSPCSIKPRTWTVTHNDEGLMILDFIVKGGFMFTCSIPCACLLDNDYPSIDWTVKHLKIFEDTYPLVFTSYDPCTLICSFSDGLFTYFRRKSYFGQLNQSECKFQSPTGSIFARIFRSVTQDLHFSTNIHPTAIVDLDFHPTSQLLVTYSANHTLGLWKLLPSGWSGIGQLITQNRLPLCSMTSKHVRLTPDGKFVFVFVETRYTLYAIDSSAEKASLVELGPMYESVVSQDVSACSLVALSFGEISGNIFEVFTAFKSQASNFVLKLTVGKHLCETLECSQSRDSVNVPSESDLKRSVLSYPDSILREALTSYEPQKLSGLLECHSLRDSAVRLISSNSEATPTMPSRSARTQWLRLNILCQNVMANGEELLEVFWDSSSHCLWYIHRGYISFVGKVSRLVSEVKEPSTFTSGMILAWSSIPSNLRHKIELLQTEFEVAPPHTHALLDKLESFRSDFLQEMEHCDPNSYWNRPNLFDSEFQNRLLELLGKVVGLPNPLASKIATKRETHCATSIGIARRVQLIRDHVHLGLSLLPQVLFLVILVHIQEQSLNVLPIFRRSLAVGRSLAAISSLESSIDACKGSSALVLMAADAKQIDSDDPIQSLLSQVDITRPNNLSKFQELVCLSHDTTTLLQPSRFLPHIADAAFLLAMIYFKSPGKEYQGEKHARSIAFRLSKQHFSYLNGIDEFASSGLAFYYLSWSRFLQGLGLIDWALSFATRGCAHATSSEELGALCALFDIALSASDLDSAYHALSKICLMSPDSRADDCMERFLECFISRNAENLHCLNLPFVGFAHVVQRVLGRKSYIGDRPTHELLYAFGVQRRDYTGASQALYSRIEKIVGGNSGAFSETIKSELSDLYSLISNVMQLIDHEQRWFTYGGNVIDLNIIERDTRRFSLQSLVPPGNPNGSHT